MIICRSCFTVWPDEALYCGQCKRSFGGRRCPKGHLSPPSVTACVQCASTELSGSTTTFQQLLDQRQKTEGEAKLEIERLEEELEQAVNKLSSELSDEEKARIEDLEMDALAASWQAEDILMFGVGHQQSLRTGVWHWWNSWKLRKQRRRLPSPFRTWRSR